MEKRKSGQTGIRGTMRLKENTSVSTDLKTILGIVAGVAVGVWAYFGLHETLNKHSTQLELMQKDLEQNTEFRIKYPRGELGQSAGEAELFMIVEHVSGLFAIIVLQIPVYPDFLFSIHLLTQSSN